MNKSKLNLQTVIGKLSSLAPSLRHYSVAAFVVFVAMLYGFVTFKINSLGSTEPTQDAVNSQVKAAQIPRIDQSVVNQLQSLQDNSVSVKALFDQARSNPFQ